MCVFWGAVLGSAVTGMFNQSSANKQMDFQKDMSDTAHQREVDDLRKAGLNPILSATGGSGASTPIGAKAELENPIPNVNAARALDLQNKSVESQISLNSASATEKNALAAKATEETKNYSVQRDLMVKQSAQTEMDTLRSQAQTEATRLGMRLTEKQIAELDARIESLRSGIELTLEKINTEHAIQANSYASAQQHYSASKREDATTRSIKQDVNLKSNREAVELRDTEMNGFRALVSRWVRAFKGE